MASGYEKAACGADPNKGWNNRPSHWWHRVVDWLILAACYGALGYAIFSMISGLLL